MWLFFIVFYTMSLGIQHFHKQLQKSYCSRKFNLFNFKSLLYVPFYGARAGCTEACFLKKAVFLKNKNLTFNNFL